MELMEIIDKRRAYRSLQPVEIDEEHGPRPGDGRVAFGFLLQQPALALRVRL